MGHLQYCTGCKRTLNSDDYCKCRKRLLYALLIFLITGGISYYLDYVLEQPKSAYSFPINALGVVSLFVMLYYCCCTKRQDILVDQHDNYYLYDAPV